MSFNKAKLKRFNDVIGCAPAPTAYDPKMPDSSHAPSFAKEHRFKPEQAGDDNEPAVTDNFHFLTPGTLSRSRSSSCTSFASACSGPGPALKSKPVASDHSQCNKQIAELERDLRLVITERTALIKKTAQLEESLHKAEFHMAQYMKDKTHLESTIASLEREARGLQHGKTVLKQKLSSHEAAQTKQQVKVSRELELKQQVSALNKELADAMVKLQEVEKERAAILGEKNDLQKQLDLYREEDEQLKQESQDLKEKINAAAEHALAFKKCLSEKHVWHINTLNMDFQNEKTALISKFEEDKISIDQTWQSKLQAIELQFQEEKLQADRDFQQERENLHRQFDSYELTLTENHREVVENLIQERDQLLEAKTTEFNDQIQALRDQLVREKAELQSNFDSLLQETKAMAETDREVLIRELTNKQTALTESYEKLLQDRNQTHKHEKLEWIAKSESARRELDLEWKAELDASTKRFDEFEQTLTRDHALEIESLKAIFESEKESILLDTQNKLRLTDSALSVALAKMDSMEKQMEAVVNDKNNAVNEVKALQQATEAENVQKLEVLKAEHENVLKALQSDFLEQQLVLEEAQKQKTAALIEEYEARMALLVEEFNSKENSKEQYAQEKFELHLQFEEAKKTLQSNLDDDKASFMQKYTAELLQFEENFKVQLTGIEDHFEEEKLILKETMEAEKDLLKQTCSKEVDLVKHLYQSKQIEQEEMHQRVLKTVKESFSAEKLAFLQDFAQEKASLIQSMEADKLQVIHAHETTYGLLEEKNVGLEKKIQEEVVRFEEEKRILASDFEAKVAGLERENRENTQALITKHEADVGDLKKMNVSLEAKLEEERGRFEEQKRIITIGFEATVADVERESQEQVQALALSYEVDLAELRKTNVALEQKIQEAVDQFEEEKRNLSNDFMAKIAALRQEKEERTQAFILRHEAEVEQLKTKNSALELKMKEDLVCFEEEKLNLAKDFDAKVAKLEQDSEDNVQALISRHEADVEELKEKNNALEHKVEEELSLFEAEKLLLSKGFEERLANLQQDQENKAREMKTALEELQTEKEQLKEVFTQKKSTLIKSHEEEMEAYQTKLSKLEESKTKQEEKYLEISAEMETKEAEFLEFKAQLTEFRTAFEDEAKNWSAQLKAKDEELESLRGKLIRSNEQVLKFEAEQEKATATFEDKETRLKALETELIDAKEQSLNWEKEQQHLKSILEAKEQQLQELEFQLAERTTLNSQHETKLEAISAELAQILGDLALKSEQTQQLEEDLKKQVLVAQRTKMENAKLNSAFEEEKSKVGDLAEQLSALEEKFREQKALIESNAEEQLQETVAHWSQRLRELKTGFAASKEAMEAAFRDEKASLAEDWKNFRDILEASFARQKMDLKSEQANLEKALQDALQSFKELQQALKRREEELQSVKSEKEALVGTQEEELETLKENVTQSLKEIAQLRSRNAALNRALKISENDRSELAVKLKEKDGQVKQQELQAQEQQELLTLREALATAQADLAALQDRYDSLHQLVGPFKSQLEQYETERQMLLSQKEDTLSAMNSLGTKYAELMGHQNQKQKIHHIIKLKDDLCRLRKELAESQLQLEKERKCRRKAEADVSATKRAGAAAAAASNAATSTVTSKAAAKVGPPVRRLPIIGQNVNTREGAGFFVSMDEIDVLAKAQEEEKKQTRQSRAAASMAFDGFEVVFETDHKEKPNRDTFLVPRVPAATAKKPTSHEFLELPNPVANKRETMVLGRRSTYIVTEEQDVENVVIGTRSDQENVFMDVSHISSIEAPPARKTGTYTNAALTASTPLRPKFTNMK